MSNHTTEPSIIHENVTIWDNWTKNISYNATNNYFSPKNINQLQEILSVAKKNNNKIRVSGQRHSQAPLVVNGTSDSNILLVDMSCYADLGPSGDQRIELDGTTVIVNTGVREDELDEFLSKNQLMLKTVTAGGFFSLGGMTSVDVHGATISAPIFAETATAFTILRADGSLEIVDINTPPENGWRPIQFARVSLGAQGIITSIKLEVSPRHQPNSLVGGIVDANWESQADFVEGLQDLLSSKDRLEIFFNPYPLSYIAYPFTVCWWDIQNDQDIDLLVKRNALSRESCDPQQFGAPYLTPPAVEYLAELTAIKAQEASSPDWAGIVTFGGVKFIKNQVEHANNHFSDLWLTEASRAFFMSYFIELPNLTADGLSIVWQALQSVKNKVTASEQFHIVAPMEFRFVKSGDSAMAGTFSRTPGESHFVNLDLIGFAERNEAGTGLIYTPALQHFFAEVEREWVALGGFPHNGKMYGFYDPFGPTGNSSLPFNANYMKSLFNRRKERVVAFNNYCHQHDPNGVFRNSFINQLTAIEK